MMAFVWPHVSRIRIVLLMVLCANQNSVFVGRMVAMQMAAGRMTAPPMERRLMTVAALQTRHHLPNVHRIPTVQNLIV
jgi:hypothetical protein